MNKKALENFVWFQFADDVDMDLRKRVSTTLNKGMIRQSMYHSMSL